eukprot:TRINITY_DN10147_c0_g2_i12.p2 TRINITY_DN10147_c0_g2~~TRINITY_DN10147_c0_g2_i12.p2  ORF type:complete len:124 (+),score=18.42 TRINITY_DN10147_c0_g2_i12:178-549(+)
MSKPEHTAIGPHPLEEDKLQPFLVRQSLRPLTDLEAKLLAQCTPNSLSARAFALHGAGFWRYRFAAADKCDLSLCLESHALDFCDRACMIEWLIEVQNKLECSELTFFKAVGIMDLFYKMTTK